MPITQLFPDPLQRLSQTVQKKMSHNTVTSTGYGMVMSLPLFRRKFVTVTIIEWQINPLAFTEGKTKKKKNKMKIHSKIYAMSVHLSNQSDVDLRLEQNQPVAIHVCGCAYWPKVCSHMYGKM